MNNITKIALGKNGPLVSKLGLGCMRMSSVWGSPTNDENESIATIKLALDNGINFLNTGDFYGSGHNKLLVGKAIKSRRDMSIVSPITKPSFKLAIGADFALFPVFMTHRSRLCTSCFQTREYFQKLQGYEDED